MSTPPAATGSFFSRAQEKLKAASNALTQGKQKLIDLEQSAQKGLKNASDFVTEHKESLNDLKNQAWLVTKKVAGKGEHSMTLRPRRKRVSYKQ